MIRRLTLVLVAAILAMAATAEFTADERERLHVLQKQLLASEVALVRAQREYDAALEAARRKAGKPGCLLDSVLAWQCPSEAGAK